MSRCTLIVVSLFASMLLTCAVSEQDQLRIVQDDWEFIEAKLVIEKTTRLPDGLGIFVFELKHKTKQEFITFAASGFIRDPITAEIDTSKGGKLFWAHRGHGYHALKDHRAFKIEAFPSDQFPPTYKITFNAKGLPSGYSEDQELIEERYGRLTGTLIISPETDCKYEQRDEVDKHMGVPRFCLKIAGVDPTVRSTTTTTCTGPDC